VLFETGTPWLSVLLSPVWYCFPVCLRSGTEAVCRLFMSFMAVCARVLLCFAGGIYSAGFGQGFVAE